MDDHHSHHYLLMIQAPFITIHLQNGGFIIPNRLTILLGRYYYLVAFWCFYHSWVMMFFLFIASHCLRPIITNRLRLLILLLQVIAIISYFIIVPFFIILLLFTIFTLFLTFYPSLNPIVYFFACYGFLFTHFSCSTGRIWTYGMGNITTTQKLSILICST